jgi:hypothetical protein
VFSQRGALRVPSAVHVRPIRNRKFLSRIHPLTDYDAPGHALPSQQAFDHQLLYRLAAEPQCSDRMMGNGRSWPMAEAPAAGRRVRLRESCGLSLVPCANGRCPGAQMPIRIHRGRKPLPCSRHRGTPFWQNEMPLFISAKSMDCRGAPTCRSSRRRYRLRGRHLVRRRRTPGTPGGPRR